MTCAVIVFPITYVLSDLFSEVYGYKWSRFTCYLGFTINLFAVGIFYLASLLPGVIPSQIEAFNSILLGTFSCTLASFIAFVVGDFVNDKVFARMKIKNEGLRNQKGFALRAIKEVAIMIIFQLTLKITYEILILPLTTLLTKKVGKYEYEINNKEDN